VNLPGWLRHALSLLPERKANIFPGDALRRLIAAQYQGGIAPVTPETCMRSPTVHAIVTAIARRFAVTPVFVYQKGVDSSGLETKKKLPNHPVAKLLAYPNSWQSSVDYWQDAASWIARYGRFFAYKSRGQTGPIRELIPMNPEHVQLKQDPNTWKVTYTWNHGAQQQEYEAGKVHAVRGPARDGFKGDSPVDDVQQAIALEIAAETFGATFFANGAVPLMIFKYAQSAQAFKSEQEEKQFIADFQNALGGTKRHRALLLPKGVETGDPLEIDNEQAQFLETRKYQRTVIAGAWGVPPHLVGDLERATFNNVEQQAGDFTLNVIMPYARCFEAAMERDLLTNDDVNSGICIRFNLDSVLRADFKSRQEGLQIQRQNGAINANEWREMEGMNPRTDPDGDTYLHPANMAVDGAPIVKPPTQGNGNEADPNYSA